MAGQGRPGGSTRRRPDSAAARVRGTRHGRRPRRRPGPRHPAQSMRRRPRHRLRHPGRSRVPRHLVAVARATRRPGARDHAREGRPALGLAAAPAPDEPARVRRRRCRPPPRVAVRHGRPPHGARAARVGARGVPPGASRAAPKHRARGGLVEGRRHAPPERPGQGGRPGGDRMARASRRRHRPTPPERAVGPGDPHHRTASAPQPPGTVQAARRRRAQSGQRWGERDPRRRRARQGASPGSSSACPPTQPSQRRPRWRWRSAPGWSDRSPRSSSSTRGSSRPGPTSPCSWWVSRADWTRAGGAISQAPPSAGSLPAR